MLQTIRNWLFKKHDKNSNPSQPTLAFGDLRVIELLADAPVRSQEIFDSDYEDEIYFQGKPLSEYPRVVYEENKDPRYLIQQVHSFKNSEETKSYEPPNELGETTRWDRV